MGGEAIDSRAELRSSRSHPPPTTRTIRPTFRFGLASTVNRSYRYRHRHRHQAIFIEENLTVLSVYIENLQPALGNSDADEIQHFLAFVEAKI